jgi:hypothetical protein
LAHLLNRSALFLSSSSRFFKKEEKINVGSWNTFKGDIIMKLAYVLGTGCKSLSFLLQKFKKFVEF